MLYYRAWVDDVKHSLVTPPTPTTRRRRSSCDMSSPSKRQRTGDDPSDLYPDPDRTPRRPRQLISRHDNDGDVFHVLAPEAIVSPGSSSSFTVILATRAAFSSLAIPPLAQTETSHSTTQSRGSSPSKRFRKMASLLDLVRPVRFVKEANFGSALPDDARALLEALSAVEAKEEILPAALRGHLDFQDTRIRSFMWNSNANPSVDDRAAHETHDRLRAIVDDSISCSNLHRSEAAWNCLVHTPLLRQATGTFPFLEVEPITSAHIKPAFRPLPATGDEIPPQRSNASISDMSSVSEHSMGTTRTSPSSVHKMVDFALVLRPENELQNLIQTFLSKQPSKTSTINQTSYEPLRTRPAPIFIETKTASGNMDTANAQLGIWVAAWHQRLRSIIDLGGGTERIVTVPVIQVVGSVWTLLFVTDAGSEIHLLDGDFRIGDTSTIVGIYQLQAAMSALAVWVKETFEPWISSLLARVNGP
ncbi:uncharacterized protein NECHADRAFT_82331 [Fusarium vanettenii 77-13-4]|uniref:PD-(D/E)XK nuclease-like domain-containing protein n=1 Tax=Fusarium vanettenii (strain ATCC MYA-4622 / CBS 123669 / FGSC 9596 / NRRL 45880 / 77-13-4) TaxID=660122 RepID=C7ZN06_FUSV7|nr:uncharacterized protein NECHADRAFT_82331 [Fusarium vanettenii 77-13-4]EEU34624.1 hypothetical protein NECHADRAFT_82331 [Fusarium vanettenii 77-13-4]